MRRVLNWTLLVVVGAAVVGGVAWALRPQPVPVDAATVAVGPMQVTVDEEGRTRIRERYVVSSPLMGRLRRITLDPGDPVEAERTVLAMIEPTAPSLLDARALAEAEARVRAAEAGVRQAGATLESARAALDYAERERSRIMGNFERGVANRAELDRVTTEQRQAAEDFRAAESGQEIAAYELEVARSALLYARGDSEAEQRGRLPVHSPIDGAVLRVLQESVAVVSPGTPLIEIGDPRDLEVVIEVLSTDAVSIAPGDRVIVEQWGGPRPLEARVRLVEPSAFTKISALGIEEQRVNVVADFVTPPEERAALGDGFRVEARIVTWEQPDALQVPGSAAFRSGEGWAVFVLAEGLAQLRAIEIGRQNGRSTQVLAGLAAGERVVLHPSDRVMAGAAVSVRAASADRPE